MATRAPSRPRARPRVTLEWTDDAEANRIVSTDPVALLIGFVLDQQVTVEKAFAGPRDIVRRLGTIDAGAIAAMDPSAVEAAFSERPAIHRFPRAMARRVQGLCRIIVDQYGSDASRIWTGAADARDLMLRLAALPGFGSAKASVVTAVLAERFGVRPAGWEAVVPRHPTLAGVVTADERRAYQTAKRAYKAQMRAAAKR